MSNNDGTSALAIIPNPRDTARLATVIRQALLEMRGELLKPGVDYGKIPGTSKDVLLKPGAEKLSSGFKLYPVPKLLAGVEDWKEGFFFYRYQIDLVHRETGEVWGTGIGSCNSREKKYAWRWVTESELPAGIERDGLVKENGVQTLTEFDFAINKAETGGRYGKAAEHWQMFKDAIEAGTAKKIQKETKKGMSDAWEITFGAVKYRIPNPEIYDLVNTIDKIAFKRAYVASVLIATGASEFFTQDLEDFASLALPDEDVIEGHVEDVTPPITTTKPEPAPAPFVPADTYKEGYLAGKKASESDNKPAPAPEADHRWHLKPGVLLALAQRSHEVGFIGHDGDMGILDMLALLNGKVWADYGSLNEAALAVKAGFEALKQMAQDTPAEQEPQAPAKSRNGFVLVHEAVVMNGRAEFNDPNVGKLSVLVNNLIAMLENGDAMEQAKGKAQIDAMKLREWGKNGSALANSTYSFPELKLFYQVTNGGTGGVKTVITSAEPVNDLRGEKREPLSPEELEKDIPF